MAKKTYEECYEIAKKYNTKKSFRENEKYAYRLASRNGWLKDYSWLSGHEKYTYEECKAIAEGYEVKKDFKMAEPQIYAYCHSKRWTRKFNWPKKEKEKEKKGKKFNYKFCYDAAEDYRSVSDFKRGNVGAYRAALRYGWLKDYRWLVGKHCSYSYEECFSEAKKYQTTRDFKHSASPIYSKAERCGWLKDYVWLSDNINHHIKKEDITYDKCIEIAKKCFSKTDMSSYSKSHYLVAKKNNWLKDYTWFIGNEKWGSEAFLIYSYEDTENKCVYVGLTKDLSRRRRQHLRKHPKTHEYDVVKKYFDSLGQDLPEETILEEHLTPAMAQEREGFWVQKYISDGWTGLNIAQTGKEKSSLGNYAIKWTKEKCLKEAKECKTLKTFMIQHNGAYQAAVRNKWLRDFDWLERSS